MPRAGLSTGRVVEEAEAIADEAGLAGVTLASIATRVGVQAPSLYKHIAGLDSLHQLVAVRAKNDLADALADAARGLEPSDALLAVAHAYRRWAHAHPGRYTAALRAPRPDDVDDIAASTRAVEVILGALDGYGLDQEAAIDATRAIRSTVHGFVSLEAAHSFELPQDLDVSFERMVRALVATIENWNANTSRG